MEEKLMNAVELAEFLGVSDKWVWRACRKGRIPYIHVGKYYRFRLQDVLVALDEIGTLHLRGLVDEVEEEKSCLAGEVI